MPAGRTPWWGRYRAEFFRMLSFGELETYDHPLACAAPPLNYFFPSFDRHSIACSTGLVGRAGTLLVPAAIRPGGCVHKLQRLRVPKSAVSTVMCKRSGGGTGVLQIGLCWLRGGCETARTE